MKKLFTMSLVAILASVGVASADITKRPTRISDIVRELEAEPELIDEVSESIIIARAGKVQSNNVMNMNKGLNLNKSFNANKLRIPVISIKKDNGAKKVSSVAMDLINGGAASVCDGAQVQTTVSATVANFNTEKTTLTTMCADLLAIDTAVKSMCDWHVGWSADVASICGWSSANVDITR